MKTPLCEVGLIPEEGSLVVDFFGREVLAIKVGEEPKAILNIWRAPRRPDDARGRQVVSPADTSPWHGDYISKRARFFAEHRFGQSRESIQPGAEPP